MGLTEQVNVRMSKDMRVDLEEVAKANWTSASQIARAAVAKEIVERRKHEAVRAKS